MPTPRLRLPYHDDGLAVADNLDTIVDDADDKVAGWVADSNYADLPTAADYERWICYVLDARAVFRCDGVGWFPVREVTPMTTVQRDALVAAGTWVGRIIWNTTVGEFELYNGGWSAIPTSAALAELIRDTIGTALAAVTGIDLTVNDPGDTISLALNIPTVAELVRDTIDDALVAGDGIDITPDDPGDTITIKATSRILEASKSATTSRNNTIVLADDPHLRVTVAANTRYPLDAFLDVTAGGSTPDLKMKFTIPAGASIVGRWDVIDTGSSFDFGVSTDLTTAFVIPVDAAHHSMVHIVGFVVVGGTVGDVVVQWSQDTSNAAFVNLLLGSWLRLT